MKKTIELKLLQQDLRVLKNQSSEQISEDVRHFLTNNESIIEALDLVNTSVGFRQWKTDVGVKNLLVINESAPLGEIVGVVVAAAHDILEYKNIESVEMHSLLVQYIIENIGL